MSRLSSLAVGVARASIWHPLAIPDDERKFRATKRVWLPLYDAIMFGAGVWAVLYGSPILARLFPGELVDAAGVALAVAAVVCFLGVAFPMLWLVEIAGKLTILGLLGSYAATVALFRINPDPSAGFVVFILAAALITPLERLRVLGEEIRDRWELDRVEA